MKQLNTVYASQESHNNLVLVLHWSNSYNLTIEHNLFYFSQIRYQSYPYHDSDYGPEEILLSIFQLFWVLTREPKYANLDGTT